MIQNTVKVVARIVTLKLLEDIPKRDIKESWSWDIMQLEDDVKGLQRKIRLAKKERGLQPTIVVKSPMTDQFYKVYQYRLIDYEKLQLCAEVKEKMTDEEVEEFKRSLV
jgi:hypothetical protein